jgi:molecular chaperone GrpE
MDMTDSDTPDSEGRIEPAGPAIKPERERPAGPAAKPERERPAAQAENPVEDDDRVAALEAELAQVKDQLLRALAEQENVRRRSQRERDDAVKYAAQKIASDLVSSADNLRRALDSLPEAKIKDEATRTLLAGVAATERELLGAFEKHGIRKLVPDGEKFDHNFHQAMFELEHTGKPAGTVVQVLQAGYVLHDRLLRPAMVGVAKGEVAAAPVAEEPAKPADKPETYHRIDTKA